MGYHTAQSVVRVCTFNVRSDEMDYDTTYHWTHRRPLVHQCLQNMQPTIVGTQEADTPQLNDILNDLNEYSHCWSWVGSEIDKWGTINAIFYRHDLFSLISTETFWFNDHPSTMGAGWGAKHPRGCTRAHLQHKLTQHPFVIYNLHLEFSSRNARYQSIPVLLSQIHEHGDDLDKVIVTGDFNNWSEDTEDDTFVRERDLANCTVSEINQMKEAGFVDTYQHDERPTVNDFRDIDGIGPKIDFIWISSRSVYHVAGETKVDDYCDEDGSFPSDHFPVYADLVYISRADKPI